MPIFISQLCSIQNLLSGVAIKENFVVISKSEVLLLYVERKKNGLSLKEKILSNENFGPKRSSGLRQYPEQQN